MAKMQKKNLDTSPDEVRKFEVVGNEPVVGIDFTGLKEYAKS